MVYILKGYLIVPWLYYVKTIENIPKQAQSMLSGIASCSLSTVKYYKDNMLTYNAYYVTMFTKNNTQIATLIVGLRISYFYSVQHVLF